MLDHQTYKHTFLILLFSPYVCFGSAYDLHCIYPPNIMSWPQCSQEWLPKFLGLSLRGCDLWSFKLRKHQKRQTWDWRSQSHVRGQRSNPWSGQGSETCWKKFKTLLKSPTDVVWAVGKCAFWWSVIDVAPWMVVAQQGWDLRDPRGLMDVGDTYRDNL